MSDFWTYIHTNLEQGRPVLLLIVVDSAGSAPGKQGFHMAVTMEGSCGTIGGGIMEFRLIEKARALLQGGNSNPQLMRQVHHKNVPAELQSGLICAGEQWLALCPLNQKDTGTILEIRSGTTGKCAVSPAGLSFFKTENCGERIFAFESGADWRYEEPVGCPDTVHVVGSGHVGLALCRALAPLDFQIIAFDDREDINTVRENTFADQRIIRPYGGIGPLVREGEQSYVVIVTTALTSDAEALEQVIRKELKYIGLMGSKAKLRRIFRSLEENGVDPALFAKVHAPIGIGIPNRTPAEIAVSVAAELIQVKNG